MECYKRKGNLDPFPTTESIIDSINKQRQEEITKERERVQAEIDALQDKIAQLEDEFGTDELRFDMPLNGDISAEDQFRNEKKISVLHSLARLGLGVGEEVAYSYRRTDSADFGDTWRDDVQTKIQRGIGAYVIDTVSQRQTSGTRKKTHSRSVRRTIIDEALDTAVVIDGGGPKRLMSYFVCSQVIETIVNEALKAEFAETVKTLIATSPSSTGEINGFEHRARLEVDAGGGERIGAVIVRYLESGQLIPSEVKRVGIYTKYDEGEDRTYSLDVASLQEYSWGNRFDFAKDTLSRLTMILKDEV